MNLVKLKNGNTPTSVSHFMDEFFNPFFADTRVAERALTRVPAVNIAESQDAYHVEVIAPGMDKSDFKIGVEGDVLSISAQKESEVEEETKKFRKREYRFGSFTRRFNLPESIDHNKIEAVYKDGILAIEIGKKEEAKLISKEISVK